MYSLQTKHVMLISRTDRVYLSITVWIWPGRQSRCYVESLCPGPFRGARKRRNLLEKRDLPEMGV
jgi:hypothetical protein